MEGTVRRRLRPVPESVAVARHLASSLRDTLTPPTLERLTIIVSELVTNAIRHAGTDLEVSIRTDGVMRVEVRDRSTAPPRRLRLDVNRTGGRGLLIVEAYSDRWGFERIPSGKIVWAEVDPSDDLPSA
jgi:anti-sigma regulatory factor (Ser/Thr protein kinase)